MADINWTDAMKEAESAGGFEVLPKADYPFKITDAELKTTSTGKDMYALKCTVTEGPHKGRVLWMNQTLSPENGTAMQIFFRKMAAIGLGADFFRNNPGHAEVIEALKNREFRGQVTIRQYQGNDRNDIGNIYPASKAPGTASAPPPPPVPGGDVSSPPVPSDSPF